MKANHFPIKALLAAAALTTAFTALAGAAQAAPWDHRHPVRQEAIRHDFRHPIVVRERVYDTLRFHHYRGVGAPVFMRGHYVVRSFDRFGRVVFVEVDPYSGAFIGEFRA